MNHGIAPPHLDLWVFLRSRLTAISDRRMMCRGKGRCGFALLTHHASRLSPSLASFPLVLLRCSPLCPGWTAVGDVPRLIPRPIPKPETLCINRLQSKIQNLAQTQIQAVSGKAGLGWTCAGAGCAGIGRDAWDGGGRWVGGWLFRMFLKVSRRTNNNAAAAAAAWTAAPSSSSRI